MNRRDRSEHPNRVPSQTVRNAALDTARGTAIALMVVDHLAVIQFDIAIGTNNVRLATRLALPLFAILFGFFLASGSSSSSWSPSSSSFPRTKWSRFKRIGQVCLASVAANVLFVPEFGKLEVLASFLACSLLFLILQRYFFVLVGSVVLFPYDPTLTLLDYPLTLAASLVAIGVVLRLHGFQWAIVAAIGVALVGLVLVPAPPLLVLLFAIPAVCIVSLASVSPEMSIGWLAWLGRYPLTVYVAQYYLIFGLRWLTSLLG
jgi:uncharacterized membrane protein